MKKILQNRFYVSLFLLVVIYLVGIVSVLVGKGDPLMQLTVYNLLFAAALLLINAQKPDKAYWIWFGICALAGFGIEVVGVQTGAIFGEYTYGPILGIAFGGVPLIIGLNWSLLVFASAALVSPMKVHILAKAALAATIMVAYDVFLEPVAIRFAFWDWAGGPVPMQNYFAWWVIAFLMLLGVFGYVKNLRNRTAIYILGIQTLFFIIIILKKGLPIH
jgi:bisanhydrobacterioruberin hydratase